MTKDFGAQLVVSDPVAALAGLDTTAFPGHDIEVRGREGGLTVRVIEQAGSLQLAGMLEEARQPAAVSS